MRASFKKRLKWYGGIFFIASLVFGVNMFQYDKVKRTYEIRKIFKCSQKHFLQQQMKNKYLSMTREPTKQGMFDDLKPTKQKKSNPFVDVVPLEERKQAKTNPFADIKPLEERTNPTDPRNGLSKEQIAEAEGKYKLCLERNQKKLKEAKSKKERTEISLGIGGGLMALTAFLALIDFIVFLFRNRKLKIKTGEAMPMENKKITKIAILSFIVWGIISFLIAQSGYRHKFHVDTFLMLNIPSLLIVGYLWIADKFTLK